MQREKYVDQIRQLTEPLDLVVIGGGATGAAIAMDGAHRGFKVALLERFDFGKGTSSRSTKLVHGGVRYLAQGNVSLVRDALTERRLLRENAPHVVHEMSFLLPCENLWQRFFYGVGFKLYDLLGGGGFRKSQAISAQRCLTLASTLRPERARGGILYSDGQFDDSRLLINMVQTACEQGAIALNYACVDAVLKDTQGRVNGVSFTDGETGELLTIAARCVVNATGPFCDTLRQLDDTSSAPLVTTSQGVHLVLPAEFLPGDTAIIVPKTSDGRVIFMIPWHNRVLVGTTDTPIAPATFEPRPLPEEIDFLLATAAEYLTRPPQKSDVLSVFTGIRPLVRRGHARSTAQVSRDHLIVASPSGMLTITGGKWTTARKMAQDCVDLAIKSANLTHRPCQTQHLKIHGAMETAVNVHGTDASLIDQLAQGDPELAIPLCDTDPYPLRGAEVVWAARNEMARTVEDILARRTRLLFLNAAAAKSAAPKVAQLLARELSRDDNWQARQVAEFNDLVTCYQIPS